MSLRKIGRFWGGEKRKGPFPDAPPIGGRMALIGCFEDRAKN